MMHKADYLDEEWFEPMPKKNKLEKSVEKELNRYAKSVGIMARKFTSPARRNVPDRIYIVKGKPGCALVTFVEVKRPGKEPTEGQYYELGILEEMGVITHWVDTFEKGKDFLDGLLLL